MDNQLKNFIYNQAVEPDYENIIKRIRNDIVLKEFLEKNNITDQQIKNHYDLFNIYNKVNASCLDCISTNSCPHSSKGMKYDIIVNDDNSLSECYYICPKYKDYYKRKDNIVYTTFKEEDLLKEENKNFFFDNTSQFGKDFILRFISILENKNRVGAFVTIKDSKLRLKLVTSLSYSLLLKNKVAFIKMSEFIKDIKSEFNSKNANSVYEIVRNSPILVIDGLGNEAISTWSRDEILLSLLDSRIQDEKPTIICSEMNLEDLNKVYKLNYNDGPKASKLIDKISIIEKGD